MEFVQIQRHIQNDRMFAPDVLDLMDETLRDYLVDELGRSFLAIPFEAWRYICDKTRKAVQTKFPNKAFPELTEESARLWYVRYCFHCEDNSFSFLKSVVTGYPNFRWPGEVDDWIKYRSLPQAKPKIKVKSENSAMGEKDSHKEKSRTVTGEKKRKGPNGTISDRFSDRDDEYNKFVMPKKRKVGVDELDDRSCHNPEPPSGHSVPLSTINSGINKTDQRCRNSQSDDLYRLANPSPPCISVEESNDQPLPKQFKSPLKSRTNRPSVSSESPSRSDASSGSRSPHTLRRKSPGGRDLAGQLVSRNEKLHGRPMAVNPAAVKVEACEVSAKAIGSQPPHTSRRDPRVIKQSTVTTLPLRSPGSYSTASDTMSMTSNGSCDAMTSAHTDSGWRVPNKILLPSREEIKMRRLNNHAFLKPDVNFHLTEVTKDDDQIDPRLKAHANTDPVKSDQVQWDSPVSDTASPQSLNGRRISVETDVSTCSTVLSAEDKPSTSGCTHVEPPRVYREQDIDPDETYVLPDVRIDMDKVEEESSSEGDDFDLEEFNNCFERRGNRNVMPPTSSKPICPRAPQISLSKNIFESNVDAGNDEVGNSRELNKRKIQNQLGRVERSENKRPFSNARSPEHMRGRSVNNSFEGLHSPVTTSVLPIQTSQLKQPFDDVRPVTPIDGGRRDPPVPFKETDPRFASKSTLPHPIPQRSCDRQANHQYQPTRTVGSSVRLPRGGSLPIGPRFNSRFNGRTFPPRTNNDTNGHPKSNNNYNLASQIEGPNLHVFGSNGEPMVRFRIQ